MEKKNKCLEILKTLVSNMWYIVALVAIIAIIFLMIANWGVVLAVIGKFLTILISYSCRFEKQGFFSKLFGVGEKALCTFRIHDEEVPRAKRLVASVLGNKNKRKEIKK